jgi:hypothetical protein
MVPDKAWKAPSPQEIEIIEFLEPEPKQSHRKPKVMGSKRRTLTGGMKRLFPAGCSRMPRYKASLPSPKRLPQAGEILRVACDGQEATLATPTSR